MPTTPNFGWTTPVVGGDNNAWGGKLNTVFDEIDTELQTVADALDAALAEIDALQVTAAGGAQRTLYLSHAIFSPNSDDDDIAAAADGSYIQSDDDDSSEFNGSLTLPPGVVLDQVDLICDKNGRTSVTVSVLSIDPSTGTATVLDTGVRSATGVGPASATAIAHTVGATILSLNVDAAGSGARYRIYGVKVLYTKSTILESL